MKTDITKVSSSAFAMTFTSANKDDYPVLYSEDQWHLAKKGDDVCGMYDKVNGTSTSASGAQFTQDEINRALSKAIVNNTAAGAAIADINQKIAQIKASVVNVYHYCGSVATKEGLPSSGVETGDVYNVESDGMNYAFILVPEKLYSLGGTYTGKTLYDIWDNAFNKGQNTKVDLMVNDNRDQYMIGGTSGMKIYAFKATGAGSGSGGGSGAGDDDFVDLSSYDPDKQCYTKTGSKAILYQLTSQWDSLGGTGTGGQVGFMWEDE